MKVAIGNDPKGYEMKVVILKWLRMNGYRITQFGANSPFSENHPDFVHSVADLVEKGECDIGILIIGNGQKVTFSKKDYQRSRAALCWSKEISEFEREHNYANILCLPGKLLSDKAGIGILRGFLETSQGGERGCRIPEKISMVS